MTFHGAGPDTHDLGGVLDGSTRGDEGCQYVHLALGRGPGKGAAQVPVPHARCLTAAARQTETYTRTEGRASEVENLLEAERLAA